MDEHIDLREMEFYASLLALSSETDLEPLLARSLELVMDLTQARWGYVEVRQGREGERTFSTGRGSDAPAAERVREKLSTGVISRALAKGEAVLLIDPELSARESVRANQIEMVICAPVGRPVPIGVVYLQGRRVQGPFTRRHQHWVQQMANQLGVLADRLLVRREQATDPTREPRGHLQADALVGRSAAAAQLLREIHRATQLPSATLITGPPGSGKTLTASVLHQSGARAGTPLVRIAVPELSAELAEIELFGVVAGARPGQDQDRPGKLVEADGGVVFFDEISELPLSAQAKLVELLDWGHVSPVGGSGTPRSIDVWPVFSTSAELETWVSDGRFRPDLYARLQASVIRVPGLDTRPEDIEGLAHHLLAGLCAEHGTPTVSLSPTALLLLESRTYPAHVRSLLTLLHQGLTRALEEGARQITPRLLMPEDTPEAPAVPSLADASADFSLRYVRERLEANDGNVRATARELDVSASYLHKLRRRGGF